MSQYRSYSNYLRHLDKNHEMDLLTSHQVDTTVEEEPSGDEEEEENQTDGKTIEAISNKVSTNDTAVVPKLSDHNKSSSNVASNATSNNKIGGVQGKTI